MKFKTGNLTDEQLEGVFDTLPFEITFVDRDDRIVYFNAPRQRIFARPAAVLGTNVRDCHPRKSLALVEQILADLKKGASDCAEFWLTLNNRLIHIRYYAVRRSGEYLGCLEVTQDITDIKKIDGEKRL